MNTKWIHTFLPICVKEGEKNGTLRKEEMARNGPLSRWPTDAHFIELRPFSTRCENDERTLSRRNGQPFVLFYLVLFVFRLEISRQARVSETSTLLG